MANLAQFRAAYVLAAQRVIDGVRTVKPFASTLEERNALREGLSGLDEMLTVVDDVNKVLEDVSLSVPKDETEIETETESELEDLNLASYLPEEDEE